MSGPLVLSLFPGIGLLDMAFEQEGFCVVRGPDVLWGGDIRTFHPPAGVFAGVIGGPPCQSFSVASHLTGSSQVDLIPEFLRVVAEVQPAWVVMENVRGAINHPAVPVSWFPCLLRDWDCGGLTSRTRAMWTWPFAVFQPGRGSGTPSPIVMATTWKRSGGKKTMDYCARKGFLPGNLPIEEYGRLQGAPEIAARLVEHHASRQFAVHVLGNGVPVPMGRYMARAVRTAMGYEMEPPS